jgi:hypothetical protein
MADILNPGSCDMCGQEVTERHYTESGDGAAAMHCLTCTMPAGRHVFANQFAAVPLWRPRNHHDKQVDYAVLDGRMDRPFANFSLNPNLNPRLDSTTLATKGQRILLEFDGAGPIWLDWTPDGIQVTLGTLVPEKEPTHDQAR